MTSHHITSHHITSHHITSYHITSHHITPHDMTSHHIISHHMTSHHITSHHIISHHITSYHITSHHIISHHITSHLSCYAVHYPLHSLDIHCETLHIISCSSSTVCLMKDFVFNTATLLLLVTSHCYVISKSLLFYMYILQSIPIRQRENSRHHNIHVCRSRHNSLPIIMDYH